ncbi:hypothetical protein CO613_11455 [Lysobacteraceae bacterium NML07-0707]|nr:hypothetical protein CO613_11455 [Xanthomonadaceae bacterium NML07-0707]
MSGRLVHHRRLDWSQFQTPIKRQVAVLIDPDKALKVNLINTRFIRFIRAEVDSATVAEVFA